MSVRTAALVAATAAAMLATPFAASAESLRHQRGWAGPGTPLPGASRSHGYYHGGYRHYPGGYYRYPRHYYYGRHWDNDGAGAAVAAGIAGLAVGAIVGSAGSGPPAYYYSSGSPQPWSSGWYRYCASRYRSFDPRSGTYLGYDGYRHFCR